MQGRCQHSLQVLLGVITLVAALCSIVATFTLFGVVAMIGGALGGRAWAALD